MATYYETFIKSQQEKTATSMASARAELLTATQSQEAYRLLLRQQIEDIDKQIDLVDKSTRAIIKSANPTIDLMDAQKSAAKMADVRGANATRAIRAKESVDKTVLFDRKGLETAGLEVSSALRGMDAAKAERALTSAVQGNEGLQREAQRAKAGGRLRQINAGLAMQEFLSLKMTEQGVEKAQADVVARRVAAGWTGRSTVELDQNLFDLEVEGVKKIAVDKSQVGTGELRRIHDQIVEAAGGAESAEADAIKAVLESRKGMREKAEAEREGIEGRLETLEAATPVTEEAVRARAAEIRTGDEFDPFRDRVKDAPTLRERVFKEGQFAKKQEAKRAQQQRFAKMSQAEKILMQQTIRAQRMLSESGDMLPPTRDSIEWSQAQSIYDQMQSGSLEGKQAVAAAHSLAVESVGKTAPPSDIKRQRDQILERFMALRLQDQRSQRIEKPQTKTTPQDLERRAFEGIPTGTATVAAEEGLPAPEVAAAPADDTEAVLASRAAGPAGPPAGPAAQPLLPGAVLFDDSPAPLGPELPPVGADGLALLGGVGSTPIDIPGALRTSPQGSTDEELIAAAERVRDQSLLRQTQIGIPPEPQTDRQDVWGRPWDLGPPPETLDTDEKIAALGGGLGSRMDPTEGGMRGHLAPPMLQAIEVAAGRSITNPGLLVQRFAASASMEEVPGSPAFHEALAVAAQSMGLPVPRWYRGKSRPLVADAR